MNNTIINVRNFIRLGLTGFTAIKLYLIFCSSVYTKPKIIELLILPKTGTMNKKNNILISIIVIAGIVLLFSCKKNNDDENQSFIPNVPVNFFIQPNTIDFIQAGSWKAYENEGYRGVLIYRLDQVNFIAYEMTCPYDPEKECAQVEVDPTTFTLIDSCCMSRYNLIDGMPAGGPSTRPLLQYFTEFDGNFLQVYNGN
jgi:LPXTG-motif cell wall-anchored protein